MITDRQTYEIANFRFLRTLSEHRVTLDVVHHMSGPLHRCHDPASTRLDVDVGVNPACIATYGSKGEAQPPRSERGGWPLWNGLPTVGANRGDPFLQLTWWMYRRLRATLPTTTELRHAMKAAYALVRDTAVHAAARCDPVKRRLALRFAPHVRWWVYQELAHDPRGYIAQAWQGHPGIAIFNYALVELRMRLSDPFAPEYLVDGVRAGAKLRPLIDQAIEAWTSLASDTGPGEDDAPFRRLIEGSTAQRASLRAQQRLLILRAGPQVPTTKLWLPPPLGLVPEDIPSAVRANATWYRAMKAKAALMAVTGGFDDGAAEGLARFVSKNAAALATHAKGEEKRVHHLVGEVVDYARACRAPGRDSSVTKVLAAASRWHEEVANATTIAELFDEGDVLPSVDHALPAPAWASPVSSRELEVQPIRTLGELIHAGRRMHHCGATRARAALSNQAGYFHARFRDEAMTVEVRGCGGAVRVAEMRRAANATPSADASAAVARWLRHAAQGSAGSGQPGRQQTLEGAQARLL